MQAYEMTTSSMPTLSSQPVEIIELILSFLKRHSKDWLNVLLLNKTFHSIGERVFDPSSDDNFAIRYAADKGAYQTVKRLLRDLRVNPCSLENASLRRAASAGHVETVRVLLEDSRVDPSALSNSALMWSSIHGHVEIVKILLEDKRLELSADDDKIYWAIERNHVEVVRLLLKDSRIDPTLLDNCAMRKACNKRSIEMIKVLIEDGRSDPSFALIEAAGFSDSIEVVELVLKDPRVMPCSIRLASLSAGRYKNTKIRKLLDEHLKKISS